MSEWWTYRLSSFLLFSPRTYFRLHELFNADIWPLQLVALALGVVIIALALTNRPWAGRVVALILAACWLFVAWAYHLLRYATINWAATYFAAAFALEAVLIVWAALASRLAFRNAHTASLRIGMGLLAFAVFAQPFIGVLAGRSLSQSQFFGVAADPTVVATLGVLIAAEGAPWILWLVPLAWCAVGGAFAAMMKLPDALMMPAAAILALAATVALRRGNLERAVR